MRITRTIISVPHGMIKLIAADLGVTPESVKRALRFATDSVTARAIRAAAVERFGGHYVEQKTTNEYGNT